ncbi:MAG: putative transcriptional regulator [Xanthobacteraceae bacterium]|jgi:probable addiction module antidote protein|nr:putative transcriptional regulator [Xanthobacteraceae bacterium]
MALSTKPFDSADYLNTSAEIAAYLDAVLEDAEPALVAHALGVVPRAKSMSEIASNAGVSREILYRSPSESGNPEFATVVKVLKALGVRLSAEAVAS